MNIDENVLQRFRYTCYFGQILMSMSVIYFLAVGIAIFSYLRNETERVKLYVFRLRAFMRKESLGVTFFFRMYVCSFVRSFVCVQILGNSI